MKQGAGLGQATRDLFKCSSCDTMITATLTFSLTPRPIEGSPGAVLNPMEEAALLSFSHKLTGVSISHVCTDNKLVQQSHTRPIRDQPQA